MCCSQSQYALSHVCYRRVVAIDASQIWESGNCKTGKALDNVKELDFKTLEAKASISNENISASNLIIKLKQSKRRKT